MKFLTEARLPFLDPYISGGNQSLLVEAVFWVVLCTIYTNATSTFLRSISKHLPFWETSKNRGGVFCGNAQDDAILVCVFMIHHGVAGLMMVYGQMKDDPIMWRHGYLLETGFELADIMALLINMYPYRHEGMKDELKAAIVFHHLPGISLAAVVLEAGLHYNEHMRAIGMWLLLGGVESCIGVLYTYCLSISTQMKQVAAVFLFNMFFFVYCRFYQFPVHSYYLIQDVKASEELEGSNIVKLLYFGATALTLFNLAILADLVPKSVRYVKRAFDGVTPLETEPVPLSRDDRMKTQKRRSSLGVAFDTVVAIDKEVSRRRSAQLTIMHLNIVQDLARLDQEEDGLSKDDLVALNSTMSSLRQRRRS